MSRKPLVGTLTAAFLALLVGAGTVGSFPALTFLFWTFGGFWGLLAVSLAFRFWAKVIFSSAELESDGHERELQVGDWRF